MNDMKQKDDTMRATPETDDAQFGTGRVSVDFARRLERERDEARELARELRDALKASRRRLNSLLNRPGGAMAVNDSMLIASIEQRLTKAKEVLGEA